MKSDQLTNYLMRVLAPYRDAIMVIAGKAVVKMTDDSKEIQEAQVVALSEEVLSRVPRIQEFGFSSNPPKDSEAIILSLGANRENTVIIACENRAVRIKNLAPGESAIYTDDGSIIHLKKSGEILVKSSAKVIVDSPSAEFTGNVKIAGNLEVAGLSTLTGNVTAGANIAATGIVSAASFTGPSGGPMNTNVNIVTSGNISGGGTDMASIKAKFNTHTHAENGTGGGTTSTTSTPL
jgi:phage baseplate assembly protein V